MCMPNNATLTTVSICSKGELPLGLNTARTYSVLLPFLVIAGMSVHTYVRTYMHACILPMSQDRVWCKVLLCVSFCLRAASLYMCMCISVLCTLWGTYIGGLRVATVWDSSMCTCWKWMLCGYKCLSLQALVSVSVTHMCRVWSSSSQAVCCGKPCEWAWQWVAHLVGSGEAVWAGRSGGGDCGWAEQQWH